MTMKTREAVLPVQVRRWDDDDEEKREGVIDAYASVYNTRYSIGGQLLERIASGAFTRSIEERGGVTPLFHEHGWRRGDAPIGTASVSEDEHGLRVEADMFMDDPKARAVFRAAEAGALTEWSVGFVVRDEALVTDDDGMEVFEVRDGDLLEASTTIRGANPDTETVGVRSAAECPVCGGAGEPVERAAGAAESDGEDADDGPDPEPLDPTDPAERALMKALEGFEV